MMYEPLGNGYYDKPWWRKKKILIGVGVGVVVLIVSIILIAAEASKKDDHHNPETPLPPLVQLMTETNIRSHLQSLQNIADTHGGNRAALHGFNASAAYVMDQIKSNTNFSIALQHFDFWYYWTMSDPILTQIVPTSVNYIAYTDFTTITYTCSGNVTSTLSYVGGGCQDSDYSTFVEGHIAFVKRNDMQDCNIFAKVMKAAAMKASAVIIWTDEDYGLFTRGLNITSPIPALSASFEWGSAMSLLIKDSTISLNIITDAISTTATTMNIIVDTGMGDEDQTIIIGSHLDSVPTGPGINDNGSGASANLELALQLLKSNVTVKNRIKFAWWAAEEFGLLGSEAYVAHLNATKQLHKVAININYDMEGSPNYITMLYNGTTAPDPSIRKTCSAISSIYQEYFHSTNTPYELIELAGGSDYNSFMTVGIPVGGLSSGVDDIKTMEERKIFGGLANTPCDPCYHSTCDTIDNVSMESVMITARSAAYVLQSLAGADLKALK